MESSRQVTVEVEADDAEEARRVEEDLERAGAQEIHSNAGEEGVLPILIIVGAIAAVTSAADVIERWRQGHQCQQLIDARGEKVEISKDCSIKNGKIIVVSSDDRRVEIHDVPSGLDIGKLLEAALSSGADAVKAVADSAGAKTSDPQPAS